MGLISPQLIIYGVIALAVMGYVGHCEYVKRDRSQFIAKLEAQAEEQQRQNKIKELANEKRIQGALSERDLALKRLRDRKHTSVVPLLPPSTTGASGVILSRTELESAYRVLAEGLQGVGETGDIAIINNRAWSQAWPK